MAKMPLECSKNEREIKILEINKGELMNYLKDLPNTTEYNSEKVFEGLLKVKYFDYPDNRIRENHELLRVRQFGEVYVEVTYKKNKRIEDGMKIYDEHEFEMQSFQEAISLFECLGLKESCMYEKKRTIYNIFRGLKKMAELVIDEYPRIPVFCEIEADENDIIYQLIKALNLDAYEQSCETINELIERKYPNVNLDKLCFN